MTLRAYDLSGRTARRGRDSLVRRVERWRSHWFLIVQTAVTAGLAWFVAERLLGHPTPFFAPVAAIITLGVTYGQRMRRGIEIAIGVAVGVLVGELFAALFGTGVWQIMVVLALAMSVATLLVDPAADHHPGLRAVGDRGHPGARTAAGLQPLAGRGGRLRPGAAGGHRRARARRCASRPGWPPRCWTHLAATLEAAATELRESDEAGRRRGAGPGPADRGGAGRAERCDRRGPGRGPAVAVPAPPARRGRGVRPAVRPAGPRQPQPPGAGPALRGRAVARRGGAGAVPGRR